MPVVLSSRYIYRVAMFANVGKTLSLLRELRGKSQGRMAREAGIGKGQLSKYETGKELPKLDSLEKVLNALGVGHYEFFYTLYLVDRRAADLLGPAPDKPPGPHGSAGTTGQQEAGSAHVPGAPGGAAAQTPAPKGAQPASAAGYHPFYLPPLPKGPDQLSASTDEAFARVFTDLLGLHRLVFERIVMSGGRASPAASSGRRRSDEEAD